ncbi:MAG: SagB/ThcOx family dehydrogenase [Acidobacteria bacterium]|nr:SagB/ThcOx family dehydrogenase [Acidobacteriota bacterium]
MIALEYHAATKHHFHRFARSLGYLDWATQPDPFRRYAGAPLRELPRAALASDVPYAALFDGTAAPHPIGLASIGELLRCSMGLSAWKQYGTSRWALRVNPSSGNLHPTEAYVVWDGRVCHYAPREHALEERCVLDEAAAFETGFLVGLTSIPWREAWKYGERAFRYCLHDTGHAIGALRLAAAMLGWRLALLPQWSDAQVTALLGVDRGDDDADAEREEPECLAVVTAGELGPWLDLDPTPLVAAAGRAAWQGRANRLSPERVEWPIIDEAANATRWPGSATSRHVGATSHPVGATSPHVGATSRHVGATSHQVGASSHRVGARELILQRRSALAFDPRGVLRGDVFHAMLRRLQPNAPPWDAIDWPPHVHLAMFVHRVEGLAPGVYAYLRDRAVVDEWKAAMRPDFLWEQVGANEGLFLLVPIDCRRAANRVSCDQDIAEDGFFSLGMLARFAPVLRDRGEWWYRRVFWECGLIGQVLYLEAEAAGGRATGIGCFYDDPMHDILGLSGHDWQSLYHFSMGVPVEDTRLMTEPGYSWEATKIAKTG